MALAQFGTQDQDQEQEQDQDQIKGERREERYKCCFDIRIMVWWRKKQIHGTPGRGRRWAVAA